MLFEAHALLPEPSKKSMVSLEHSLWRLNVYAYVQPTSLKSKRHGRGWWFPGVCVRVGVMPERVCVLVCVCVRVGVMPERVCVCACWCYALRSLFIGLHYYFV